MHSITQTNTQVKTEHYQSNELLDLADHTLRQWQQHRAQYLATGDPSAWRLAEALKRDRLDLLAQVGEP